MYFAVVKLTFEAEPGRGEATQDLRALVEKIRARFKVCAAICGGEGRGAPSIAVTALASSEQRLTQNLDAIADFCETSGFGRVEAEEALLDHIDNLGDFAEEDA